MVKAWVVSNGDISIKEISVGEPKSDEVVVEQKIIGVNNLDLLQKKGAMESGDSNIIGCEAFGTIVDLGSNVEEFEVGDRVAYCTSVGGAFSEKRIINHKLLVHVPNYIEDDAVVALLMKAMTAHMLLRRTFFVTKNNSVLVHNASGGLGQLICTMGQHYEAKIIAVASGNEDKSALEKIGVKHIIDKSESSLEEQVKEFTDGEGANLVIDHAGSDTFKKSVNCVSGFGLIINMMDSYGTNSEFNLSSLFEKSAFITCPNTFIYKQDRAELLLSANEVFALTQKGIIKPNISASFGFSEADKALEAFENGSRGQVIIRV